jgi:amidohydrolase
MIEDGAMENPAVAAIFALHVYPGLEVGAFTVAAGPATAAADSFDIEILGRGGHAAHPHQAIDAIAVAAQVVSALQLLVSRQRDPLQALVITIGKIDGGFARNVIAPSVRLSGTARSPRWRPPRAVAEDARRHRRRRHTRVRRQPHAALQPRLPVDAQRPCAHSAARSERGGGLGRREVDHRPPSMGGEDFAYYAERVPGLMARIGVRNDRLGFVHPLHHPQFDLDEGALPLGASLLADLAHRYLASAPSPSVSSAD